MNAQLKKIVLAIVTLQCYITYTNAVTITLYDPPGTIAIIAGGERELRVNAGDTVTLQCVVPYDTSDSGRWLYEGNVQLARGSTLVASDTAKYGLEVSEGYRYRLQIRSLTAEDTGEYRCSSGSDFDSVNLIVLAASQQTEAYAPEVNAIVDSTGVISVPIGGQAQLSCTARAIPPVTEDDVSWYFEGSLVSTNPAFDGIWNVVYSQQEENVRLSVLTLTDVQADKVGYYACLFKNSLGSNTATIQLQTILHVPSGNENDGDTQKAVDTSLRVTSAVALSSTSIQVDWEAGLNTEVDSYRLLVESYTTGTIFSKDVSSSYRSAVVNDLQPNTEYHVSVSPSSGGAYGETSNSVTVTTEATEPSITDAVVVITNAVALSCTSIQVEWEVKDNTAIQGFRMTLHSRTGHIRETSASASSRSKIVDDLQTDTEYEIWMKASAGGGQYGPRSNIYTVSTSDGSLPTIKPRRYDITDLGSPCLFKGWVDVQGQGAANDYCRVVSNGGPQFLSCALAGSTVDHVYTSPRASGQWFDAGHVDTWYMKDKDGDGRDDYCRCVGVPPNTVVSCMKAGDTAFLPENFQVPDSTECHYNKVNPFFGVP